MKNSMKLNLLATILALSLPATAVQAPVKLLY